MMYGSPAEHGDPAAAHVGLLRYRSAPSVLLEETCGEFLPARPVSPDAILARFISADPHHPSQKSPLPEGREGGGVVFGAGQVFDGGSHRPASAEHCYTLSRHNSSAAEIFSSENSYGGGGGLSGSGSAAAAAIGNSSLDRQISFSSSQEDNNNNGRSGGDSHCFIPSFQSRPWVHSPVLEDSFNCLNRPRSEAVGKMIAGANQLESQNGLARHCSLPMTSSEMAVVERLLQFNDAVPCKVRAKRGCATHPRSIAERVRRTKISERIKKLQELVPNMDKQTNTSDMLDLAVDYIKDLQKQVQTLSDNRASCTCVYPKQKHIERL